MTQAFLRYVYAVDTVYAEAATNLLKLSYNQTARGRATSALMI